MVLLDLGPLNHGTLIWTMVNSIQRKHTIFMKGRSTHRSVLRASTYAIATLMKCYMRQLIRVASRHGGKVHSPTSMKMLGQSCSPQPWIFPLVIGFLSLHHYHQYHHYPTRVYQVHLVVMNQRHCHPHQTFSQGASLHLMITYGTPVNTTTSYLTPLTSRIGRVPHLFQIQVTTRTHSKQDPPTAQKMTRWRSITIL